MVTHGDRLKEYKEQVDRRGAGLLAVHLPRTNGSRGVNCISPSMRELLQTCRWGAFGVSCAGCGFGWELLRTCGRDGYVCRAHVCGFVTISHSGIFAALDKLTQRLENSF
jgi:hypothetical protein